jgi:hypothetical protein
MRNFLTGFLVAVLLGSGLVSALSYRPTEDSCVYGYKHHLGYSKHVTP